MVGSKDSLEKWISLLKKINRTRSEDELSQLIQYLQRDLLNYQVDEKTKNEQEEAMLSALKATEKFIAAQKNKFKKVG